MKDQKRRATKSAILPFDNSMTVETGIMRPNDIKEHRDFFISYTRRDHQWAEWIALQLEKAGYTLFIQAWDFRPGSNFVAEMDHAASCAERTLLVLSSAYLESEYAFAEWAVAFADSKTTQRKLLPVRIEPCEVKGLLRPIVYIDLVSLEEAQARERLLEGVQQERIRPSVVAFPGTSLPHIYATFPGSSLPPIWNIPYSRNPVFTGQEQLLARLEEILQPGKTIAPAHPQAISGLGGIGKTQLAVEYAYRHHQDYQAILWTLADSQESLTAGYVKIAQLLDLPQKDEQDQELAVNAVQIWLAQNSGWLLIMDNADNLALAQAFLPPTVGSHLLLTTRAQIMGRFAQSLEVDTLIPEVGALLLLRRAGIIPQGSSLERASSQDRAMAQTLSQELGGLPLALDQAGAYIEETMCGLGGYHSLYQTRQKELLQIRGGLVQDHPEPVATTWSLSFERVELQNPAAAELLRLCAFLSADAIPEELLAEGAEVLGEVLASITTDVLLLNQAITVLRAYSLLSRDNKTQSLTIHRLVQTVLRNSLTTQNQQNWIQRTISAVVTAYPGTDFANWSRYERLLPHALVCATWIKQTSLATSTAFHLLSQAGSYLRDRGRFAEAEPLLERAFIIAEQEVGPSHPNTVASLSNLASLYYAQGKYTKVEQLLKQVLATYEQALGTNHLFTAISLNNLAELYRTQGKYEQAEPLYTRALAITQRELGTSHPDTMISFNNLALLYYYQGKYEQAEPLYTQVLAIAQKELETSHPFIATSLSNLAELYRTQGKYEQAEPLSKRALEIREQELGISHPDTATSLNNLAELYQAQGKYEQAKPLLERALNICEYTLGPNHPKTQAAHANYTALLNAMKWKKPR